VLGHYNVAHHAAKHSMSGIVSKHRVEQRQRWCQVIRITTAMRWEPVVLHVTPLAQLHTSRCTFGINRVDLRQITGNDSNHYLYDSHFFRLDNFVPRSDNRQRLTTYRCETWVPKRGNFTTSFRGTHIIYNTRVLVHTFHNFTN